MTFEYYKTCGGSSFLLEAGRSVSTGFSGWGGEMGFVCPSPYDII